MTVSVIVPVKNDAWLSQALTSINTQSYKQIELIVVHDPDGEGAARTRNRGLRQATGEFVAFCDADDYLEPDAIGKLVDEIDGSDMVAGSFRKFGEFSTTVSHEARDMTQRELAEYVMANLLNPRSSQMLSGCWAKLYRRRLTYRFPDLTTAEDMAFNFDYLRRHPKVRFIPDIVYNNRKHSGSLTTTFDESNKPGLFGFLQGLVYVEKFLRGFFSEEEIRSAIDNSKVYHSMLYFMRICAQNGKPMSDTFKMLYP